MNNVKNLLITLIILLAIGQQGYTQNITLPPGGANQKASVTQWMGLVKANFTYNSPDVTSPTGEDRTGKIWGALVPWGMVNLGLNLPLFLVGVRWGGGARFFFRTIYAVVVLSAAIDFMAPHLPAMKGDPLLYILFGGLLDGLGVGLVLRGRGTTGGTDIVTEFIAKSLDDLNELIFNQVNKIDGIKGTQTNIFLKYVKRRYDWGTALDD